MVCTTTPSIEGKKIVEYKGIVFGEVISCVNFVKDFAAGLSNFFGGRSGTYENELIQARENAIAEMENRARRLGADAVVGVKLDYEVLGANNGMLMVIPPERLFVWNKSSACEFFSSFSPY
ncbi:MAG: UPF0145 protein [Clostridium sp.]|jgi:uncharacterized protein YbjQ (UPF0145 family)